LVFFLKWPDKLILSLDVIPIFSFIGIEDLILAFNAFINKELGLDFF